MRPFQQARRQSVDDVLDRAQEREEVPPELDRELAADLLGPPLYYRMMILGGKADLPVIDRLTAMLCSALAGTHSR